MTGDADKRAAAARNMQPICLAKDFIELFFSGLLLGRRGVVRCLRLGTLFSDDGLRLGDRFLAVGFLRAVDNDYFFGRGLFHIY